MTASIRDDCRSGNPSPDGDARAPRKVYRRGTDRVVDPEVTLQRARSVMAVAGITRVATITGLDRIGIPVVTACRPNARSISVSQGKGITLAAAKASAVMEAIECFHAENLILPLRFGSDAIQ